jgi:hypothetical protein
MAKKSAKMPVEKLKASTTPQKKLAKIPVPVKIVHDEPETSNKDSEARERRYRAEDALRDLERAKKHESDKALMADVKKLASERVKALKDIC